MDKQQEIINADIARYGINSKYWKPYPHYHKKYGNPNGNSQYYAPSPSVPQSSCDNSGDLVAGVVVGAVIASIL